MDDFRLQINEDIADYQERFPYIPKMKKNEWAFNYWVLDKLYSIDEEAIIGYIIDYDDLTVDCYVWNKESKDLYLIQNKYYSEDTTLDIGYVRSNFLVTGISNLEKGTYTHSPELQKIFSENKNDEDFTVHLNLYATINPKDKSKYEDAVRNFNSFHINDRYIAHIYWLNDLESLFFGEPIKDSVSLKFKIKSVNKGTILSINKEAYGLNQTLNARYVFTPILNLFDLVKTAKEKEYPIFDENIREYLGSAGTVNKGIYKTLTDPVDRRNFFYYNNGITVIVDKIGTIDNSGGASIEVSNPQIVNGCQTVSTIYEALDGFVQSELEENFKDVFVMVKILEIPQRDEEYVALTKNIVKYNNSQNDIGKKAFDINKQYALYLAIQRDYLKKGFLVCIKQSDKNQFTTKYGKKVSDLLKNNQKLLELFGINESSKVKDYIVDLEKLLQVYISIYSSHEAVQNKSKLLKDGSSQNIKIQEFIKSTTFEQKLYLWLLYLRVNQELIETDTKNKVNPFMFINCFIKYQCNGDCSKITNILSCKENIDEVLRFYRQTLTAYYRKWTRDNSGEYNAMIKVPIDFEMFEDGMGFADPIKLID